MTNVDLVWETQLTDSHREDMAALFDVEYLKDWGPWVPKRGYGYAPLELHALVYDRGRLVGHAGSARRFIQVGPAEVLVAGIGGVVTAPDARGRGVGRAMVSALREASRTLAKAEFGLLGCREEVIGFYENCGLVRVHNTVRDLSPRDAATVVESRGPTLIHSGIRPAEEWPTGTVDLRGLPW
jgi:aminoglycoside 2'-N-acetyltransferase I